MKYGALIPLLNEFRFLPAVVGQLLKVVDRCVIVRSSRSQAGMPATLLPLPPLDPRVEILNGDWGQEHETRNAGMEFLQDCDYIFTVDSDEIMSTNSIKLLQLGCQKDFRVLACRFYTYWKTCEWRVDPPEELIAPIVLRRDVRFKFRRAVDSQEQTLVNRYLMHHLSYVRTDEEMKYKISTFAHAAEILPGWYERVWKGWDDNHSMEDLHPTHPHAYKRVVPATDTELKAILAEHGCS